MENENRSSAAKNSYDKTKQFITEAYEELYAGEVEVDPQELNPDLPHTIIGDRYFQAEFDPIQLKKGQEAPLTMMDINKKPQKGDPLDKKRQNSLLLYTFADERAENEPYQTLSEISDLYGVTRENVRLMNKIQLANLHANANSYVQGRYSLESLETRRPITLSSRVNLSIIQNGSVLAVRDMVRAGMTTEEINQLLGSEVVSNARNRLEKWEMDRPDRIKHNIKKIAKEIDDPTTTLERLREIAESDNMRVLNQYYRDRFSSISDLQFAMWGNKNYSNSRAVAEVLRAAQIPVYHFSRDSGGKRLTYRGTFKRMEKMAISVLRSHPEFGNSSVIQIAGEEQAKLPNTNELYGTKKGEYVRVKSDEARRLLEQGTEMTLFSYSSKRSGRHKPRTDYYMKKDDYEHLSEY